MRLLSLFFLALLTISDAAIWTLNSSVLEESLPQGVQLEELIGVLKKEGIEVCLQEKEALTLWKEGNVTTSLAARPFSPYHLWVELEGRKTLDECTKDELWELYAGIWKARSSLAKTTGAGSFMIFTSERMEGRFVRVEIIPSGFGKTDIMDAVEKNALNDYVFYNRIPKRQVFHSPKAINVIRGKLEGMQMTPPCSSQEGHWTQKLLRHKEALHRNLYTIYDALLQSGALVAGEMPPMSVDEGVHEIRIDLDKCAFCNPKVIEKQLVCDWKQVQVLMSHKPVSCFGNFLILPKRHSCAWDLTKEEAIASFEAVIALKKMLTGKGDWICYIQDGPAVGQTVPHTHIHFYVLPDQMKMAVAGLQHIHNERPILLFDEMRYACEKAKSQLAEILKDDY